MMTRDEAVYFFAKQRWYIAELDNGAVLQKFLDYDRSEMSKSEEERLLLATVKEWYRDNYEFSQL